jgi:hypothetical protein
MHPNTSSICKVVQKVSKLKSKSKNQNALTVFVLTAKGTSLKSISWYCFSCSLNQKADHVQLCQSVQAIRRKTISPFVLDFNRLREILACP